MNTDKLPPWPAYEPIPSTDGVTAGYYQAASYAGKIYPREIEQQMHIDYRDDLIAALRARLKLSVGLLDIIADHIGDIMPERQTEAVEVIAACKEPPTAPEKP